VKRTSRERADGATVTQRYRGRLGAVIAVGVGILLAELLVGGGGGRVDHQVDPRPGLGQAPSTWLILEAVSACAPRSNVNVFPSGCVAGPGPQFVPQGASSI